MTKDYLWDHEVTAPRRIRGEEPASRLQLAFIEYVIEDIAAEEIVSSGDIESLGKRQAYAVIFDLVEAADSIAEDRREYGDGGASPVRLIIKFPSEGRQAHADATQARDNLAQATELKAKRTRRILTWLGLVTILFCAMVLMR